jgi:hypothetical protein
MEDGATFILKVIVGSLIMVNGQKVVFNAWQIVSNKFTI